MFKEARFTSKFGRRGRNAVREEWILVRGVIYGWCGTPSTTGSAEWLFGGVIHDELWTRGIWLFNSDIGGLVGSA